MNLVRGIGVASAMAINISQVVGAGVFLTIPLILAQLPGVYGLLAWLVAGLLILCDAMIWAELGAALPSSGGSYHFLRESYGRNRWGRLMGFLFVWQILISGPLELGSGLVAAAQFSNALDPRFKELNDKYTWSTEFTIDETTNQTIGIAFGPARAIGLGMGVLIVLLLYRNVTALGKLSLVFVIGVLALIGWVLVEGALRFDSALAFEQPPLNGGKTFGSALGAAMALALYSYFGYYNVCYLGGEVRDPARTIPRSILASVIIVIVLFTLVQLVITGAMPWQEARDAKDNLTAEFMQRIHGPWAATAVAVCLIASCFASVFAGTLGYSRVPYAAARDGHFFTWFAAVHSTHRIPHRSLLLIGGMMLFWSFFNLDAIITALIATRILEQFVAQILAVMQLRRAKRPMPWRMWLYPLPCAVALVGWLFVYFTTGTLFILIGAGTLLAGAAVFLIRSKQKGEWPFEKQ